jgi:hypothetical protein
MQPAWAWLPKSNPPSHLPRRVPCEALALAEACETVLARTHSVPADHHRIFAQLLLRQINEVNFHNTFWRNVARLGQSR